MSLQVKKDMENIDLDPCSAHNSHLPVHVPLFATNQLEALSTSLGTFCGGVCTGNASSLNSATLGDPKMGVGQSSSHNLLCYFVCPIVWTFSIPLDVVIPLEWFDIEAVDTQ